MKLNSVLSKRPRCGFASRGLQLQRAGRCVDFSRGSMPKCRARNWLPAEDQPDAFSPCQPPPCRDKKYVTPLPLDVGFESVLTEVHSVLATERLPFMAQASAFAPMPIRKQPLRGHALRIHRRHQFCHAGGECRRLFCLQRGNPRQKIRSMPVGEQQSPLIAVLGRDIGARPALHRRRHRSAGCLRGSDFAKVAGTQQLTFAVALMMQGGSRVSAGLRGFRGSPLLPSRRSRHRSMPPPLSRAVARSIDWARSLAFSASVRRSRFIISCSASEFSP